MLKGVEADILQDGRIDFDDAVLARLDFVIASIHSRFNMAEREMTARMLAAMDNPHLTIIGHPTGRLLLSRDPYGLDLDAVIEKAAATGVALEINADPHRLDLDWRVLRQARDGGAQISIGADAHNVAGIANCGVRRRHRAEGVARARPTCSTRSRWTSSSRSPRGRRVSREGPPAGAAAPTAPRASAAARAHPDPLRRLRAALPRRPLRARSPERLRAARAPTILSAQCTDARVNLVTPVLFARYPDAGRARRRTDRGGGGDHPAPPGSSGTRPGA